MFIAVCGDLAGRLHFLRLLTAALDSNRTPVKGAQPSDPKEWDPSNYSGWGHFTCSDFLRLPFFWGDVGSLPGDFNDHLRSQYSRNPVKESVLPVRVL